MKVKSRYHIKQMYDKIELLSYLLKNDLLPIEGRGIASVPQKERLRFG